MEPGRFRPEGKPAMKVYDRYMTVPARLAAALLLCACDPLPRLSPDPTLLTAQSTAPAQGPDCSSCHAYPLRDVHHQYHLVSVNVNRNNHGDAKLNSASTCMDCHFTAVRRYGYVHSDTVWGDADGNELEEHTSPTDIVLKVATHPRWRPVPYPGGDTLRGEALADEIDTLVSRRERLGETVEWMTSMAHNNGKVDVAFPPNAVSPAESLATAFRVADLSCSTVACHSTRNVRYRWKNPAKGLGGCPSLSKNDSACGETKP